MTFEEYLKATNRPETVRTKLSLFKNRILSSIGGTYLNNFGITDDCDPTLDNEIRGFLREWDWAGLSPQTIKSLLYIFKDFIRWRTGLKIDVSKYIHSVMKKRAFPEPKALTKTEAELLLKTCQNYEENNRIFLMILLALHSGLRRGEIFGLRWEDLDFGNSCVWVKRSYNGPTKNGKIRKVPMSNMVKKEFLAIKPNNSNGLRVFKLFNPNLQLKHICSKLGLREISFHGLRHTFCTLALNSGKNLKQVSEVMGHTKVSTTIDLYWSTSKENLSLEFLPQI